MQAQLMGAAGQRFESEPGEARSATHHFPGACGWQAVAVCLHPPTARLVALGERNVDTAFVRSGSTFDHCPIALADFTLFEQLAEQRQRLSMPAEHKATGGVAVEPVSQCRRTRQSESQRIEIVLKSVAALRASMNRQSCRFVDDQHKSVAVKQAGEHLFRCHAETAITGAAWTTAHKTKTGGNA